MHTKEHDWVSGIKVRTLCQSYGPEVVDIHDDFVHLQWNVLYRGFDLHAAVTDQHIHVAVALTDLCNHILHAVYITEIQQHQLGWKGL